MCSGNRRYDRHPHHPGSVCLFVVPIPHSHASWQTTQLFNILGGGGGYLLCANAYVPELVAPAARTGAFGQQQGAVMLARAVGFTAGGLVADRFGISAPFRVTFALLVCSTVFSFAFLPYVAPPARAHVDAQGEVKKESAWAFLAPMKVFWPARVRREDGSYGGRKWGLMCLGIGEFLAVFSTGWVHLHGVRRKLTPFSSAALFVSVLRVWWLLFKADCFHCVAMMLQAGV
jgi:MFS family permease